MPSGKVKEANNSDQFLFIRSRRLRLQNVVLSLCSLDTSKKYTLSELKGTYTKSNSPVRFLNRVIGS